MPWGRGSAGGSGGAGEGAGGTTGADSKVVLLWENGTTATYTYRLGASPEGRTIELTGGDGSTQICGEVG